MVSEVGPEALSMICVCCDHSKAAYKGSHRVSTAASLAVEAQREKDEETWRGQHDRSNSNGCSPPGLWCLVPFHMVGEGMTELGRKAVHSMRILLMMSSLAPAGLS